ncbi:MAG TPA: hypothetical protein VKA60_17090 [Blastocatellia bacterium]|nr:hypothetical protein [Blastocatellia bacterium]
MGCALLCVLAVALPLAAQNQNAPQKAAPPSPYLIETLIDINEQLDLKQVWRVLDIKPPTDADYHCRGGCEAETFDIETGEGKTVALKITHQSANFYQYLLFRQTSAGGWKLLGTVACFDQRYGPPAHRIEHGDGRTWMVVRELAGRGMGMVAYEEGWNEIRDDEVKEVLSYPVEGRNQPCLQYLGHSYKAMVLRHGHENGTYTIPVQFMIAYNISTCDPADTSPSLFAKGQKAFFVWNAAKDEFVLDERRSEVTEKQLDSAYTLEGASSEAFVEDNFAELAEVATRGDARRKAWLKNFLSRLQSTPHKAELLRLLQP